MNLLATIMSLGGKGEMKEEKKEDSSRNWGDKTKGKLTR